MKYSAAKGYRYQSSKGRNVEDLGCINSFIQYFILIVIPKCSAKKCNLAHLYTVSQKKHP